MKDNRIDLWLRTDETEEAISSLEMFAEISATLVIDPYRWKWAIIALHNALQGFMVLSLRRGNGLLVLKDEIAEQWLTAHREGGRYPIPKLDNFLNLYKKIKSDRMLCYVSSGKFNATSDHNRSARMLNTLRNEFIHFTPKGWSLDISGLPTICLSCLEIVEFLGWKSGNIAFREEVQKERSLSCLIKSRRAMTDLAQAIKLSE